MSLLSKTPEPQNEYLKKYLAMATRFQNIGIVVVLSSIALNLFGGAALKPVSLIVFFGGAIALAFGGSSLLPHNLIKSFAQQCYREPNTTIADGLLEAMERNKKTGLTKNSIGMVNAAIASYASIEDADPELVSRLQAAAKTNLSKKVF